MAPQSPLTARRVVLSAFVALLLLPPVATGYLSTSLTGARQWHWENPTPQGNDLFGLSYADDTTGFAVGRSGVVLRTTDAGDTWGYIDAGVTVNMYGAAFIDENRGWIVGDARTIRRTTDGGLTWETQSLPGTANYSVRTVAFFDSDHGICAGTGGAVFFTTNGGSSWQLAADPIATTTFTAVEWADSDTAYVTGATGIILKSTDRGATWSALTSGVSVTLNGITFPEGPAVGYAVGNADGGWTVLKTEDGGGTWTPLASMQAVVLYAVDGSSADRITVVGAGGAIWRTDDGGATWTRQSQTQVGAVALRALDVIDDVTAFAAGAFGVTLSTRDAGMLWRSNVPGTIADLHNVSFTSPVEGWAVGSRGTVMHTTDGGDTWIGGASDTVTLRGVSFPTEDIGFIAGDAGTVRSTADGGRTWLRIDAGTSAQLNSVCFASGETSSGVIVGNGGLILRTDDGGVTWAAVDSLTTQNLNAVRFTDPLHGWAVGNGGVIRSTSDGGLTWTVVTSGTTRALYDITGDGVARLLVAGATGTLRVSDDGGTTWSALTSGTTQALYALHFTDPQTGWAAGAFGTLLHTTDGGSTWQPLDTALPQSGTNIIIRDVFVSDAGPGVLAASAGAIRATSDSGLTWHSRQSGSIARLNAIDFPTAEAGWVAGFAGTVMHTSDAGASWYLQKPGTTANLFGIDMVDPVTGWAAGAAGALTKTSDGGRSWQPQVSSTTQPLSSISAHSATHAMAVGAAGTVVATTDGSTWSGFTAPSGASINTVHLSSETTAWVGTGDDPAGVLFRTDDGGVTWTSQLAPVAPGSAITDLFFLPGSTSTGWAVSSAGDVISTDDGGETWGLLTTGTTWGSRALNGVHFIDENTGRVVGATGTVARTTDGGSSWELEAAGTNYHALYATVMTEAGDGWCVGSGGALLRNMSALAPETTAKFSPSAPDGENDWYVSPPTITLKGVQKSGAPVRTYYRWSSDASEWTTYTVPVLAKPGADTLEFFSRDVSGNGAPDEVPLALPVRYDPAPPSVPGTPTALGVTYDSVLLDWVPSTDTISGLSHYEVWEETAGLLGTTMATTFLIDELTEQTTYEFAVHAVDLAGLRSRSVTSTIATPTKILPLPPDNVYARSVTGGSIFVNWDPARDTSGTVEYRVWRSRGAEPFAPIGLSIGGLYDCTFVDGDVDPAVTYRYAVSTLDDNGESERSALWGPAPITASATPARIQGLTPVVGSGSVLLSWSASSDPGVTYRVMRGTRSSDPSPLVLADAWPLTSYLDSTTDDGVTYWYTVSALDASGSAGPAATEVRTRFVAAMTGLDVHRVDTTGAIDTCPGCHDTHVAPDAVTGYRFVVEGPNEVNTCVSCHSSTTTEFTDPESLSDMTAWHEDDHPNGITCVACHTAVTRSEPPYDGLLHVGEPAGGTQRCYSCHGADGMDGEPIRFGDLTGFEASAHRSVPTSDSVAAVACLGCHETHSSRNASLLRFTESMLCRTCHAQAGTDPASPGMFDLLDSVDATMSGHPLSMAARDSGAALSCSNCHNSHVLTGASPLIDPYDPGPQGTWPSSGPDNRAHCLSCHDGGPFPASVDTSPWAGAVLGSDGATRSPDIATAWTTNVHGDGSGTSGPADARLRTDMGYAPGQSLACEACHDPHASGNPSLLRHSIASADGSTTVGGLLVLPIPPGSITPTSPAGADLRYFCSSCHIFDPADHDARVGGVDTRRPGETDCTTCHHHVRDDAPSKGL